MKHRLCVVCIAVFVLAMGATTLQAQDRLLFASIGETENLLSVISTRILSEAYGRIGIEITTRVLSGPRALSMSNQGSIDGELFRGKINGDQFPNLIRIPVPIMYGEIVVFTKDVEFEVVGWDSLRPYSIGIQYGVKEIEDGTKGMRVEPVRHSEQLLMKLATGRNDIVVHPRDLGLHALKAVIAQPPEGVDPEALQGIRLLEPPLQRDALFHYLHNKHAELVPKLTVALQEMADEGLIQRIREKVEAEFYNQ